MDFDLFKHVLPKIGKMYLPGHELQGQMVPEIRKKFLENPIPDNPPAKWAAVICLFYPGPLGKTHFVMIRRSDDRGSMHGKLPFQEDVSRLMMSILRLLPFASVKKRSV